MITLKLLALNTSVPVEVMEAKGPQGQLSVVKGMVFNKQKEALDFVQLYLPQDTPNEPAN